MRFTRSRPYHKNDNAHGEQKNWTHERCLLGYERLENPDLLPPLNAPYRDLWGPYHNHFCPSVKLLEKRREGARQIRKSTVRTFGVVILPPDFQFVTRILNGPEEMQIEAFVAQSAIEGLDQTIFDRPTRPDKVQLHLVAISPGINRPRAKLCAIVHRDRVGVAPPLRHPIQALSHTGSRHVVGHV